VGVVVACDTLNTEHLVCPIHSLRHRALLAHATWNTLGAGGSLEHRQHLLLTWIRRKRATTSYWPRPFESLFIASRWMLILGVQLRAFRASR
jgi:hypothetical protein